MCRIFFTQWSALTHSLGCTFIIFDTLLLLMDIRFDGIQFLAHIMGHIVFHDDVIRWKHFLRYWPFVRGIHRSPVNSPHKGQWRWALMFCLICASINGWVRNGEAGDLRRHRTHYVMMIPHPIANTVRPKNDIQASRFLCCCATLHPYLSASDAIPQDKATTWHVS